MFSASGEISDEFKQEVAVYSSPTGMLAPFLTTNVGDGWLLCDGREVSRTTYAALYNAIGTRYGAGDEATTFELPDLRGRSVLGAGAGTGLTTRSIEDINVGEERHTMIEAELAPHTHSVTDPVSRTEERGDGANLVWKQSQDGVTGSTGSATPFNVIHPCLIAYWFVKT
jgi:microcystin-dependent protein